MRRFENLGVEPVLKPVAAIQPGDCIPVAEKTLVYRQACGLETINAIARIPTLRFRDFRPSRGVRYSGSAILSVYCREDIEAALELQILAFLKPGMSSKLSAEIFGHLREQLNDSPGEKRIQAILRRMAEQGRLLETIAPSKSGIPTPSYRLPLTACALPQVVMERQHYRVGWVVGFEERQPAPRPYPLVQWFNGSRSLVRDQSLEPLLDKPRALLAMAKAIAHLKGDDVSPDFVRVPREMLRRLISSRGGMNMTELMALGNFIVRQGVQPHPCTTHPEAALNWLERNYPGWLYGVLPYELMVLPDGVG